MLSIYGVIFNTTINSGISKNKALKITIDMINKLSDSAISAELPKKSLEILHGILFNGIHGVLLTSLVLLLIALVLNALNTRLKKAIRK